MSIQLTDEEVNLVRQWFNAVQDLKPAYLQAPDFKLAARVYEACGARLPSSITQHLVIAKAEHPRKGCGRKIHTPDPYSDGKCGFQYMPNESPQLCTECGGRFDLAE